MKNVVIFGGTFNPLHKGHIEIISALSDLEGIDEVLLIPDKIPPHKKCDFLALDEHRLNMCRIIAKRFSNVSVCDIELKRDGKSYTIDTLKEIRRDNPDFNLSLAIGGDMLVSFDKWKDYKEILALCQIIVLGRGGVDKTLFSEKVEHFKAIGGQIFVLDNEITEISSTTLRENMRSRDLTSKYIDNEILDYIYKNNVYGE